MELTSELIAQLNTPFDPELVAWKPGATNQDKTRALALAYVEPRAYIDRLNEAAGADWSDDYEIHAGGAVVLCRLTVAGVTRSDVGEAPPNDQNTATSAIAQAFKRACVKFGLGAYLYNLPRTWAEYDPQRKQFTPQALAKLRAAVGGNGNGRDPGELDRAFPRYGNGQAVADNALETYKAHVKATGQAPANVEALRAWYKAHGGK
jgi:hypothetical protein